SSLPPSYGGNIGDGYITQNDGHLWIWNGSGWDDVGLIRGPQGERGYQGYQGFQGNQGNQGVRGYQGTRGYQGYQGEKGSQGNQGSQGLRGYQGYQGETGDSYWVADTYGIHYNSGNVGIGTDTSLIKGLYVYVDRQYGGHIRNTRTISGSFGLRVDLDNSNANSYILYLYSSIGPVFDVRAGGSIYFSQYGKSNYTGTAAKFLAVTSVGKVIEVDAPAEGSSKWTEENGIIRATSENSISMLNNRYLGFNVYWDSDWKHLSTGYAAWIKQESDGNFQISLSGTSRAAGNIVQSTKIIKFQNTTGNIIANNFVLASLRKLKKWIKNIVNLEKFDKIKIQQFVFKSDESERVRYGVIADDVEDIAPELVYSDDKGNKEVAYIDLAMAKIARLEERIKKLENGS
ncbi:MAG: tail fiber domain-containing protein, partial [Candidatus Riflebacteria bacterium]|nr:tail fiber domain-containing protein [Candidatus Riflebacteria bacterium]